MNKVIVSGIGLSGGGLILLENYLKSSENENVEFIVFSEKKLCKTKNSKIIIRKYFKSFIGRLYFIFFGFTIFYIKNKRSIKSILSFVNLGFPLVKNTNQVVYYHQPIPLINENWSLLKKEEKTLWFYKNIYPILIKLCNRKEFFYVAQTSWVAKRLTEKFKLKNIIIEQPYILEKSKLKNETSSASPNNFFNFIYPAGYTTYKNHIEIINALDLIKQNNPNKLKRLKINFTLDKSNKLYKIIKKKNLDKYFNFIGHKPILDIYKFYSQGYILLFPSKIETFGLPLLEAAQFGCQIISGDTPFANEILCNYNFFKCNFDNPKEWSTSIIKVMGNPKNISSINYINKNKAWAEMNARLLK